MLRRGAGAVFAMCLTASVTHAQDVVSADYIDPTTRYPHGVLGDDVEYGGMRVRLSDRTEVTLRWNDAMVFEDLAPRLVDLDGDGGLEVITIDSHAQRGARLSIWDYRSGTVRRTVSTPHIGTRFRWLAPVAWRDLDGDGQVEIAFVDRPHLAKVLHVYRYVAADPDDIRLDHVASLDGLTNHRIGWDYIIGGVRACGQEPEMILADADWTRVMAVRLQNGALTERHLGPYTPDAVAAALACRPG